MIRHVYLTVLLALAIMSCSEDEVVTPVQPAVDTTTISAVKKEVDPAPTVQSDSSTNALGPDSAFYRSALYQNMPYRIMFPRNYDPGKQYPLLVFLHGIDERGTDNTKQLKWGASLFQSDSVSKAFPSFVIFPQCPANVYWSDPATMRTLADLIRSVAAEQHADTRRIYIAGLSMGAFGTYAMAAANPDLFAAAVAISGDGDVNKAKVMAKPDWRIYGGGQDITVPGDRSEKMAKALKDSGASVELKIYPDANHVGSWVKAFAEQDFVSWIFSKRKI